MNRIPLILISSNPHGSTGAAVASVVIDEIAAGALHAKLLGDLPQDPEVNLPAQVCLERARQQLVRDGFAATSDRAGAGIPDVLFLTPGADMGAASNIVRSTLEQMIGAGVVAVDRVWNSTGDEFSRAELHYFKKLVQPDGAAVVAAPVVLQSVKMNDVLRDMGATIAAPAKPVAARKKAKP